MVLLKGFISLVGKLVFASIYDATHIILLTTPIIDTCQNTRELRAAQTITHKVNLSQRWFQIQDYSFYALGYPYGYSRVNLDEFFMFHIFVIVSQPWQR